MSNRVSKTIILPCRNCGLKGAIRYGYMCTWINCPNDCCGTKPVRTMPGGGTVNELQDAVNLWNSGEVEWSPFVKESLHG